MSEASFVVTVSETEIVNHRPEGTVERVVLADLKAVLIETNDSGPWGADVCGSCSEAVSKAAVSSPEALPENKRCSNGFNTYPASTTRRSLRPWDQPTISGFYAGKPRRSK